MLENLFQTESRTTLHAVITMDGVYAGFAWTTIWILSVDNVWTNIGYIRVKMSGTNFPTRSRGRATQERLHGPRYPLVGCVGGTITGCNR